jgi:DnaK suppressor protein
MRKRQKDLLKQKLFEQRALILRGFRLGILQSMSGEITNAFDGIMDEGDVSLHNQSQKMLYRRLGSMRETVRKIETALGRLENGEYGICGECNGEIALERLRIIPYALYCKECQEAKELQRGD